MVELLNKQEVMSLLIDILILAIPALLGSFGKDYLDVMTGKNDKAEIAKIFLSTSTATFIMVAVTSFNIEWLNNIRFAMFFSFLLGMVGFQLFVKLSTLEGLIELARQFQEFRRGYFENQNLKTDIESKQTAIESKDVDIESKKIDVEQKRKKLDEEQEKKVGDENEEK